MRPETQIITLGVRDLDVSRNFYVHGLGWKPKLDVPGEVIFIQIGYGILLSLFGIEQIEREAGDVGLSEKAPPIAFGHLVESPDQFQQIIDRAIVRCTPEIGPLLVRVEDAHENGYERNSANEEATPHP